jgi:hypothetical protein
MTLTPAYGRDYKSAKAAKADYAENKDFVVNQFGHPHDGRYANRADLDGQSVTLRFGNLRKVCVTK